MITKCINNNQIRTKTIGSTLFWSNKLYTIEAITSVPRRFRSKYPQEYYSYCTLKKIRNK